MRKSIIFTSLVLGASLFLNSTFANAAIESEAEKKPSTRSDAVIFKIHDVVPIFDNGVVTGCDYSVTLYNRTFINFRTFTLNLNWNDVVEERFHFDKYAEAVLGADVVKEQQKYFENQQKDKPLHASITINAFGANRQLSLKSHIDNEKCYLLLSNVDYTVTPCDIARSLDVASNLNASVKDNNCTQLFQFVGTQNPEYFGSFKPVSATEEAFASQAVENRELSDIDAVIGKIVENMGTSDKALTDIK